MKLLRTKVWCWYDIGLLKWCCVLIGMVAGAYLADMVKGNVVWFFCWQYSVLSDRQLLTGKISSLLNHILRNDHLYHCRYRLGTLHTNT